MVCISFRCAGCGELALVHVHQGAPQERIETGNGGHVHYYEVDGMEGKLVKTKIKLYDEGRIGFYMVEQRVEFRFLEGTVPELDGGDIYTLKEAKVYPNGGDWDQPCITFTASRVLEGRPNTHKYITRFEPDDQQVIWDDRKPRSPQHPRDNPGRSGKAARKPSKHIREEVDIQPGPVPHPRIRSESPTFWLTCGNCFRTRPFSDGVGKELHDGQPCRPELANIPEMHSDTSLSFYDNATNEVWNIIETDMKQFSGYKNVFMKSNMSTSMSNTYKAAPSIYIWGTHNMVPRDVDWHQWLPPGFKKWQAMDVYDADMTGYTPNPSSESRFYGVTGMEQMEGPRR